MLFYTATKNVGEFISSTSLPAFWWYVVVQCCGFNLHFSVINNVSTFSCAFWPSIYILLWDIYSSYLLILPLFFELYKFILYPSYQSLWDLSFINVRPPVLPYFPDAFWCVGVFILVKSNLSTFFFVVFAMSWGTFANSLIMKMVLHLVFSFSSNM